MSFIVDPDTGELFAPFLRSGYNYDRDAASIATGLVCCDPSLTQQQFKEDADINTIVERFGITGKMPDNLRIPTYGDFTGVSDFRSALAAVEAAERDFMALPANIRADFDNDPQQFLEFADDPSNFSALREMGLTKTPPTPAASAAPPSPAPSSALAPAAPAQSST